MAMSSGVQPIWLNTYGSITRASSDGLDIRVSRTAMDMSGIALVAKGLSRITEALIRTEPCWIISSSVMEISWLLHVNISARGILKIHNHCMAVIVEEEFVGHTKIANKLYFHQFKRQLLFHTSTVKPECRKWPWALSSLAPTTWTHQSRKESNPWSGSSSKYVQFRLIKPLSSAKKFLNRV